MGGMMKGASMNLRDLAAATAKAWEKHAHAERYIETKLHPKAMGWLVDEIEKTLATAGASAPTKNDPPKGKAKAKAQN